MVGNHLRAWSCLSWTAPAGGPLAPSRTARVLSASSLRSPMSYRSPDIFRTEDALDPLRDRPDFRLLLMDLAMPAEALARRE